MKTIPKRRAPSAVRGKEGIYTRHSPDLLLSSYDLIVGLDQSKSGTGWAIYRPSDGTWTSGVKSFKSIRHYPELFSAFVVWLTGRLKDLEGNILIVFEEAHHQGGAATLIGVGLAAMILGLSYEMDADCISIHTGTLKKAATGNGAAGKADMVDRASEIAGRPVLDDNEADAICLAWVAGGQIGN